MNAENGTRNEKRATARPTILFDVAAIVGLVAFTRGLWLFHPGLAYVVLGLGLFGGGVFFSWVVRESTNGKGNPK